MKIQRILLTILATVVAATLSAPQAFASIVYIDGNEVWVSSDDGSVKKRLSGGENDWRQVAQSDNGYIVGIRKEAGKISQLASFTVWNPQGKVVHFGSLSGHIDSGLNAYPSSLDITPDGGLLTYGYSRSYWVGASYYLVYGSYLKATADGTTAVPYSLDGWKDATVIGDRVVAHDDDTTVSLQAAGSSGSTSFTPWFTFDTASAPITGLAVDRTDVAATGTTLATEFRDDSFNTQKILMVKAASLGGAYVDDCLLPTSGAASDITISQNGATIAWRDARGVVVAGAPDFAGAATCNLTRAPRVISSTGSMPSYGPFNISAVGQPVPPSQPGVASSTSLKITTKKPKSSKKIAIKLRVQSSTKPAGNLTISVDGKVVKRVAVTSAAWKSTTIKKLKKGRHRITATFSGTGFKTSSKTVSVKVR